MRRYFYALWLPIVALGAGWLLALTSPLARVDLWLGDTTQHWVSHKVHFKDALVIDIDDASIEAMRPQLGSWPYSRDTHALILDWLSEHGARAVVFDILFADPRLHDDALATALARSGKSVLIAVPAPGPNALVQQRLAPFAWQAPDAAPALAWSSATLPTADVLDGLAGKTQLALAAAREDVDGVLRRLPLLHRVDGQVLPSPALASMISAGAANTLNYDPTLQVLTLGSQRWPVDTKGMVRLAFPANADAVLSVPFRQVAQAALGLVKLDHAQDFFAGKTVFIGSTTQLADRVNTPRGVLPGTTVLALGQQALQHGHVLAPPRLGWNALLLSVVLITLWALAADMVCGLRQMVLWSLLGTGTLLGLHLGLLAMGQDSTLAMLLAAMVLGLAGQSGRAFYKLRRHRDLLAQTASTDSLTGLLVRRAFLESFATERERARRQQTPLSIAVLDLDHFKRINDTYGHPVGDLVIKTFARILRDSLRTIDIAGRWGGEEFVVVLPNTTAKDAAAVLDRVRVAMAAERFPPPATNLQVTVSAGVAPVEEAFDDLEAAIACADQALYQAKTAGRNRVHVALMLTVE